MSPEPVETVCEYVDPLGRWCGHLISVHITELDYVWCPECQAIPDPQGPQFIHAVPVASDTHDKLYEDAQASLAEKAAGGTPTPREQLQRKYTPERSNEQMTQALYWAEDAPAMHHDTAPERCGGSPGKPGVMPKGGDEGTTRYLCPGCPDCTAPEVGVVEEARKALLTHVRTDDMASMGVVNDLDGFAIAIAAFEAAVRASAREMSFNAGAAWGRACVIEEVKGLTRACEMFLRHVERTYPGISLNDGHDYSLNTPGDEPLRRIQNADVSNITHALAALHAHGGEAQ